MGLSAEALELIAQAGYSQPTPVQAASIPVILKGTDIIASAQTGSGKTAAFVLPIVERMIGRKGTQAIVLSPTREIVQQTLETFRQFGEPRGVRAIPIIGGVDMVRDFQAIRSDPQVIVATPGRLCDHIGRGLLWLEYVQVLVLDEADRMLDMGFAEQLNRIMSACGRERQTLLFSATFPPAVETLARKLMNAPERITIGRPASAATTISHRFLWMGEDQKTNQLIQLIRSVEGTIIVFTATKMGLRRLHRRLRERGIRDTDYISSDRDQRERNQVLANFKNGRIRVLLATDVAARGLHIENVEHVINYDLPADPENYIHRIGRTGRAGAEGDATSFVTPNDELIAHRIEKLLGHKVPAESVDGFVFTPSSRSRDSKPGQKRRPRSRRSRGRSSHRSQNSSKT